MKNKIISFKQGYLYFPESIRNELCDNCVDTFVVTASPKSESLYCYAINDWESIITEIRSKAKLDPPVYNRLLRIFVGTAQEINFIENGKVKIPKTLREHASLNQKALVIKEGRRYELWDPTIYSKYTDK
ncbi:MAG: hypothetical protein KGV46_00705 [Pasteurella sp.]|nr:hypothetical protein [Pasteurella sp.]